MHIEPTRLLADWLSGRLKDVSGVDQGINAQLQYLVTNGLLDGNDSPPELVKAVLDTTRDDTAARADILPLGQFPVVVVQCEGPGDWEPSVRTLTGPRDCNRVPFSARYITDNLQTAKGEADFWYTCRAMQRSVKTMLLDSNMPQRVRNQSMLMRCVGLRVGPAFQQVGGGAVIGGVIWEFFLRDAQP